MGYYYYMEEKPDSSVRLFSYHEDQPNEQRGALIPRSIAIDELVLEKVAPETFRVGVKKFATITLVPVATLATLALVFFAGYGLSLIHI